MRAFLKPDEVFSNLVEGTEEALNEVFSNLVRGPHGCLTRYYTSLADRRPEAQIRRLNRWERNRITRLRGQAVKTSPFHGGNTGSIPVGVIWRHSQVVRQRSATPLSPVQIWLAPLKKDITENVVFF